MKSGRETDCSGRMNLWAVSLGLWHCRSSIPTDAEATRHVENEKDNESLKRVYVDLATTSELIQTSSGPLFETEAL